MSDPVAAAIAFGALGANLLATALLFLFNPRSREVRWYLPFLFGLSLWLLSLGVLSIRGDWTGGWAVAFATAVTLLPGLFLASTLADTSRRWGAPWAAVVVSVAMVPVGLSAMRADGVAADVIWTLWHVVGWGAGAYLHWQRGAGKPRTRGRGPHLVVWTLLLIPPLAVAGGMLIGAQTFFTYVMPVVIFFVHVLVFAGVIWLRFYDIEVRAARSGELAARATETERLAAVGELAASIAHEVRNPLTGVRSLAQRMAEEELEPERWRRYAAVIVEEVGRIDRIVSNLLGLARRGWSERWNGEPTPLAPLFEDLALLTSSRAARAGVMLRLSASGMSAPAPREALASALLNLLINAIGHTPAGGTVELAARGGERVEIWIRDSGPGVPAGERERIFEPFHTGAADGTGIGLSVVRRIARELDWEVSVEDAPGGGAVFRLRLP
jgi:signal transduction histidine kinase